MYNPGDSIYETFQESHEEHYWDYYKVVGGSLVLQERDWYNESLGFWYEYLFSNANHDLTGIVAPLNRSANYNYSVIHPQFYWEPTPPPPPLPEGAEYKYWAFTELSGTVTNVISGEVPNNLAPGTYYIKGRGKNDSWLVRGIQVVAGMPVIPQIPDRLPDYDSDLTWDEQYGTWIPVVAGGGRYKQQIVAIGELGEIYFGDV